jgi:hypothetical protein
MVCHRSPGGGALGGAGPYRNLRTADAAAAAKTTPFGSAHARNPDDRLMLVCWTHSSAQQAARTNPMGGSGKRRGIGVTSTPT